MKTICYPLMLLLLSYTASACATIYREVSPSGHVTFSDHAAAAKTGIQQKKSQPAWVAPNKRNRKIIRPHELKQLAGNFDDSILSNWLSGRSDCGSGYERIDLRYNNYLRFFANHDPLVIPIIKRKGQAYDLFYSGHIKFQYDNKKNVLLGTQNNTKPQVRYICNEQDISPKAKNQYTSYLINQQFLARHSRGKKLEITDGAKFLEQECRRAYQAKEYKTARSTCNLAAANKKNVVASYYMGMLYRYNRGGDYNYAKSYKYTAQAANAGFSPAYVWMGWHYRFAKSVRQDLKKSLQWYMRAVDAGDLASAISVANAYMQGKGVEQDFSQAAVWYLVAARAGDDHAQNKIGSMYANGVGVKQNYPLAHEWILKAHNKMNPKATYNLAVLYDNDKIVKNGAGYAIPLYKKARQRGINTATDIIDKYDRVWLEKQAY